MSRDPGMLPNDEGRTNFDSDVSEWPEHFPKNCACPPSGAQPTNMTVYRRQDDYKSWDENDMGQNNDCRRAALSCFTSIDDCREVMAVHADWAEQPIVSAELNPEHGKIKQTGKNRWHYSLWLRRKFHKNCHRLFQVLP